MGTSTRKPKRLTKAEFLEYWARLRKVRQLQPAPIPYEHEGSTYSEDSIRITGSRKYVDAVLSRLQDLLVFENNDTRLHVNYSQTTDRETGQPIDAWNCYIQVRDRGREAKAINTMFNLQGQR